MQQIALSRIANRNKIRQRFRKKDKNLFKNKTNKVITDSSRMRMKTSKKTLLRRRTRRRVRSLRSAAIRKSVQSKAPRGIM